MAKSNALVRFLKSSGVFLIGSVLSRLISFFMLPLYTGYINPDDYGYYDLSTTYIAVLTMGLFLNVWTSVMRFMYDEKNKQAKYSVILSGWTIFGVSTIAYGMIGVGVAIWGNYRYIFWVFLYGLVTNIVNMYGYIVRGIGKYKQYAISGLICTVVLASVNIFMLVYLRWDFSCLYIAYAIGCLFQIVYMEHQAKLLKNIRFSLFNAGLTKKMFRYTLPLCLHSITYWLLINFNKLMINNIMGDAANGIYAVGAKFGAIITLATTCFTYAWQDLSFSHTSENGNDGKFYSRANDLYTRFLGSSTAVIIPACYLVFPFMVDPSYADAKGTIPLFLLVGIICGLSQFIANTFFAIKDTKTVFISTVAACVCNVLLSYPLIRLWGLNGANTAMFISFLVNIVIQNVILKRKVGFRTDLKMLAMLVLWIGLSTAVFVFGNPWMNGVCFLASAVLMLFMFRDTIAVMLRGLKKKPGMGGN